MKISFDLAYNPVLLFVITLILSAPSNFAEGAALPNSKLTPGDIDPSLTTELICGGVWKTTNVRNVPESLKKKVFERYRIPWANRSKYEVDHLASLQLGGSNDIKNLWPQAYCSRPRKPTCYGAIEKDYIEGFLHRQVCKKNMTLKYAQKIICTNWVEYFKRVERENLK